MIATQPLCQPVRTGRSASSSHHLSLTGGSDMIPIPICIAGGWPDDVLSDQPADRLQEMGVTYCTTYGNDSPWHEHVTPRSAIRRILHLNRDCGAVPIVHDDGKGQVSVLLAVTLTAENPILKGLQSACGEVSIGDVYVAELAAYDPDVRAQLLQKLIELATEAGISRVWVRTQAHVHCDHQLLDDCGFTHQGDYDHRGTWQVYMLEINSAAAAA